MLNLSLIHVIDDAKCYEIVRQRRWEAGLCCTKCNSPSLLSVARMKPKRIVNGISVKTAALILMT